MLAAFKAELVVGLAADRPASGDRQRGQTGAASGEWAAQLLDEDVSEFFPDELALVLNCSRTAATQQWERSTTLRRRLPATWAALADGWLDWPRARAIAAELGWPARESPDDVLAAVEAVVLPQATGLSITRLRALVRAELIKADPAAADRRRKKAERDADVTVRGRRGRHGRAAGHDAAAGGGGDARRGRRARPRAEEGGRRAADRAAAQRGAARPGDPPVAGAAGGERARRGGGLARHAGVRGGRSAGGGQGTGAGRRGAGHRRPGPGAAGTPRRAVPGRAAGADRRHAVALDHRRGRAAGRRRHPPRAGDAPSGAGRGWARRRRWTGTSPPPPSGGSRAPATAPAGTPAAATAPAGPTSTTSSRTPRAGRPTAPTCAACVGGTTG